MKSFKFALLPIFLFASVAFAAPKEEPQFKVDAPEQTTLKNGLRILWIPDNSLPYISLQMMFKTGSSFDPADKAGLANFTASLLEKGSSKRTANQIADDLDQLGASFGASVDADSTFVGASSLSFYKDNILKQFAELVLSPIFPNAEIERQRKIAVAGFTKLADSPKPFMDSVVPEFLYGNHPYGHDADGNIKSIKRLHKNDIQKFYNQTYVPGNAVLAVVGKFDEAYKALVVKTFDGWKAKPFKAPTIPEFPQWTGVKSLLVDRADLQQAQIQILFKGVPRNIKEYLMLRASLKLLGESFGSRLFEEIREKRGLTYHISAWFDPREQAGPMGIYTFTRVDKIDETINETLKVYRTFVKDGVTDKELTEVRALMKGQLPRLLETRESFARQLLALDRYGVGIEYFKTYFADLDSMTKEDVNKTIRKYYDPDNLKILVYAPKDKAAKALQALGSVEVKSFKDYITK